MAYRNTLQADALKLVAKKLQSSLAVEGELPEDGLAAYGDDGDDLMMALARKIVSGDEEDETRRRWRRSSPRPGTPRPAPRNTWWTTTGKAVEIEPEAIAVNGNGHHANGIGPSVELLLGNGRLPVNGNGHHDEAPEPQQSLFSWAEFHGRRAGQAEGQGRQDPGPVTVPVRVGGGTGAGGGAGRRGTLDRKDKGGGHRQSGVLPLPVKEAQTVS